MQINNSTPVSFGASVDFSMSKRWGHPNVPESLKNKLSEVEKMFSEQTKGEKGNLNIDLYQTEDNAHLTFVGYVGMGRRQIFDDIFWIKKEDNQTLVDKLKDILKYCKKDEEYRYKIRQKEHELNIAEYNLQKFKEFNGYHERNEELSKKISQKEDELLKAQRAREFFKFEMRCHFANHTRHTDINF